MPCWCVPLVMTLLVTACAHAALLQTSLPLSTTTRIHHFTTCLLVAVAVLTPVALIMRSAPFLTEPLNCKVGKASKNELAITQSLNHLHASEESEVDNSTHLWCHSTRRAAGRLISTWANPSTLLPSHAAVGE